MILRVRSAFTASRQTGFLKNIATRTDRAAGYGTSKVIRFHFWLLSGGNSCVWHKCVSVHAGLLELLRGKLITDSNELQVPGALNKARFRVSATSKISADAWAFKHNIRVYAQGTMTAQAT